MTAAKVTPRTRQIVLERDGHCCVVCGRYIGPLDDYSLQHRRARGMGGSKRPDTNLPANLVTLCGHATSPDGCHARVESHRDQARAHGLTLTQSQDPTQIPVHTHRGWLLLDNEGFFTAVDDPSPEDLCGCGLRFTSEGQWTRHIADGCQHAGTPRGRQP